CALPIFFHSCPQIHSHVHTHTHSHKTSLLVLHRLQSWDGKRRLLFLGHCGWVGHVQHRARALFPLSLSVRVLHWLSLVCSGELIKAVYADESSVGELLR